MILTTSITQQYLEKSKPFFESTVKNFPGKRICFCIGFITDIEGWETVEVPTLEINWQPANRKEYYSLQHGEFTKYYNFEATDVVLFCDSDMILQRKWDMDIKFEPGTFYVSQSSFPPTPLKQVVDNLGGNIEVIKKYDIGDETEFCAAFMIASVESWKILYNRVKINRSFLNNFIHHAAWQLLINYLVQATFKYYIVPPRICSADWYNGSPASYSGDYLVVEREVVYFNHTKFNR